MFSPVNFPSCTRYQVLSSGTQHFNYKRVTRLNLWNFAEIKLVVRLFPDLFRTINVWKKLFPIVSWSYINDCEIEDVNCRFAVCGSNKTIPDIFIVVSRFSSSHTPLQEGGWNLPFIVPFAIALHHPFLNIPRSRVSTLMKTFLSLNWDRFASDVSSKRINYYSIILLLPPSLVCFFF